MKRIITSTELGVEYSIEGLAPVEAAINNVLRRNALHLKDYRMMDGILSGNYDELWLVRERCVIRYAHNYIDGKNTIRPTKPHAEYVFELWSLPRNDPFEDYFWGELGREFRGIGLEIPDEEKP